MRTSPASLLATHVLVSLSWLAVTISLVDVLATAFGTTTLVIACSSAILFLFVSTILLAVALHRWRRATAEALDASTSPAEVTRLRRMYLGAVSHELRVPLKTMIGDAEALRDHHAALEPHEVADVCDRLVRTGERVGGVVLDLLDLDRDNSTLEPTDLDLDRLLDELVVTHGDADQLQSVRSDVGTVRVDEHTVTRILCELLDNVHEHTPPGTRVTVTGAAHNGTVLLVVEDDGPGIDPAVGGTIADPFVRGGHITAAAATGLGVGLSLAAHHARRHGGQLRLARSTAGGTRATVVLPTLP